VRTASWELALHDPRAKNRVEPEVAQKIKVEEPELKRFKKDDEMRTKTRQDNIERDDKLAREEENLAREKQNLAREKQNLARENKTQHNTTQHNTTQQNPTHDTTTQHNTTTHYTAHTQPNTSIHNPKKNGKGFAPCRV
jgi:hypothetical protein